MNVLTSQKLERPTKPSPLPSQPKPSKHCQVLGGQRFPNQPVPCLIRLRREKQVRLAHYSRVHKRAAPTLNLNLWSGRRSASPVSSLARENTEGKDAGQKHRDFRKHSGTHYFR
eukprot:1187344-Prorocentrum_minimum.AAC.3